VAGTATFTLTVQLLFGASVPFENEMEVAPAVGEKIGVPQLLVVAPGVAPTTIAPGVVGKVSVKSTPVMVALFGFVIVKVKAETPLMLVGSGLKFFDMLTLVGSTILAMRAPTP
jgi:hypothetical protein